MHPGLSQKIGKAGDARAFANDVDEITVFIRAASFGPRTVTRLKGAPR